MTGKTVVGLPREGEIQLKIDEAYFTMLTNNLVEELKLKPIIALEAGKKVTFEIAATRIISPEEYRRIEQTQTGFDFLASEIYRGMISNIGRSRDILYKKVLSQSWHIFARTTGGSKREICIILHPTLGGVFSFKKKHA